VLCEIMLLRRSARVALYMAIPPPYVPCTGIHRQIGRPATADCRRIQL
jgi:hypothetical protein